jgi:SAM-dependent methyltransferase
MDPAQEDFEFAALNEAVNYRRGLLEEFGPYLQGHVMEVGSGIGQLTSEIVRLPGLQRLHAVEPNPRFFAELQGRRLDIDETLGTVFDVPSGNQYDAIISVNVLEHIEQDAQDLRQYQARLRPGGHLCLFVPACPSIYADMDRTFGHFRRYRREDLRRLLVQAGFEVERLHYYNSVGYFAWWLNFCVLKKTDFEIAKVRFFDRAIFPLVHGWEYRVMRPPFGQSLMAVARH